MVSIDHFAYELRAASQRRRSAWLDACCKSTQQEVQPGDILFRAGLGMAVQYQLPGVEPE
jgi:hypothetical protein